MATNRWLNTINNLKTTADTLRGMLISGGVNAKPNDTLDTLVAQVPKLAPRIVEINEKWEPDPLWVFQDPYGSGASKTIRQIYDEDPMADAYTYRGIYMFYGNTDDIDLKSVMGARTSADTFITSDGITYTDITETSLIHAWDKEKDITDSKNQTVRYVKIYTNTAWNCVPGFYRQLIWAIHNLGTVVGISGTAPGYTKAYYLNGSTNVECLEFGSKVSSLSSASPTTIGYPRKIRFEYATNSTSIFPSYSNAPCWGRLMDIEFPNWTVFNNSAGTSYYLGSATMKSLEVNKEITQFTIYRDLFPSLQYINLEGCDKLTSMTITTGRTYYYADRYNSFNQMLYTSPEFIIPDSVTYLYISGGTYDTLYLPNNLTSLNLYYLPIKNLVIPESVTTLNLSYLHLEEITIPTLYGQTDLTTPVLTLNTLYDLKRINIPLDFNRTANFSCDLLEHENLLEILTNLKNNVGFTKKTLTLGTVNLSKLTDDEKAIATNKNWTLA